MTGEPVSKLPDPKYAEALAESRQDAEFWERNDGIRGPEEPRALADLKPAGWFNPWNDYHGYQQVAAAYEDTPGTIPLYHWSDVSELVAERDKLADDLRTAIAQLEEARAEREHYRKGIEITGAVSCQNLEWAKEEKALRQAAEARLEELTRERDEAIGLVNELDKFQNEVFGWLKSRGLVDDFDDEWDGFVAVIEEHEAEIEAATARPLLRRLEEAKAVLGPFASLGHAYKNFSAADFVQLHIRVGDLLAARAFLHQGGSDAR